MFAQVGLYGNVTLKDKAQCMKFAPEASMNFVTAVYSAKKQIKQRLNSDVKIYDRALRRTTSVSAFRFINQKLEEKV